MAGKYLIQYGLLTPQRCEVHGEMAERFGTLVDPQGHKWLICARCINGLWDATHWAKIREEADDAAEARLAEKLASMLRGD